MGTQIFRYFSLKSFILVSIFVFSGISLTGQITGKAFRDYNGDGIQQAGEPNRGNIVVKFYSNGTLPVTDVLLGSATTASDGTYSYSPPSYPVRIEFEIPDGFCNLSPIQDFSAGNGNTYGTAVQFADGPGVHNFILTYPADFALTDNPPTFTSCFVNGDPLVPGSSSTADAFVGMNYLDNGHGANSGYYPSNPNGGPMGPPHDVVGTAAQVGAVWGIAISKQARKIFTSAILKRHAGLGPLGGGGIYMIDPDNYSTSYNYNWLDFDADLNIPTSNESGIYTHSMIASNQVSFSPVIGTNTQRGMTGNKLDPSRDAAAWEQVGKVSFGDLDISEDGRWLYVINLYDRKLYQMDLVDPFNPVAPVLADVGTKVKGFTIPDPCSGNAGEHMPFAIKVTRGKVFVGLVCNGQALNGTTIGTANDLMGHIYEFDMATETFNLTPVLSFPLNYRSATANPWLPWTNQFQGYFEGAGFPMITDIEFDGKGNMIIGMVDRRGHQGGWYNYDLNGSGSYAIAVVGDVLQGLRDPNSAACSYSIQFTPEFYKDDKFHPEPVNGGLATHRTSTVDNTIVTYMDPVWIWSGGTMRFDNLTGNQIGDGYEIYFNPGGGDVGTFGKAAGIGDIETLGEVPLLEIGNIVWSDVDRDGVQDPDEPVLSGVIVELVNSNGDVVGTSTTDSDGGYYFNYTNTNDPAGNGTLGPQPYTDYTIRISSTQYNNFGVNGSPLEGFVLTNVNQAGAGLTDYSDNDAVLVAGIAEIAITTDGPAENNHTFDFGFYPTTFDVALAKTTSLTLPVTVGQDVPFIITVTNQGTDIVNSISITDYIPAGYIYNATDNPDWTGSFPTVSYTASVANGLLPGAGIAVGASFDITLILEVAATANANNIDNFAEITGGTDVVGNDATDDIDSTPDNDPANDAGGQIKSPADDYIDGDGSGTPGDGVAATDEDDHDGATIRFIDVALIKDISSSTPPPYQFGSPVTYVITVFNQSNEDIQNIEIEDDLPAGFSFTPNNGWTESSPGVLTNTIAGPIAPGANSFVELILTPIPSNVPNAWINNAQITGFEDENGDPIGDRDFDSDPGNGPSGGLEDDDDNEVIEIFDLALRKTLLTGAPYNYGQTLTFEIEVFNQGNVPASNILVKDHIPNGYSYVSNNGWTGTLPNLQNTIAGPIAPGSSATLQLELILQTSSSGSFTNYAEIAGGNGPSGPGFDADSNPDSNTSEEQDVEPGDPDDDNINGGGPNEGEDEDDHDPAGPSIFDLALRKTVDTATPSYSYGQSVMYTIRVFNQGNIAARDIEVRDTIPCGFEFDPMDLANAGWTQNGQVITRTISSVLNPGQSAAVMVNYIVRPCYTNPATAWTNYAEISDAINDETGLPGEDIDSSPDDNMENDNGGVPDFNGVLSGTDNTINNENGDEDDHDPHQIQVFDLALRKVLATAGPYSYGQTLTFQIEIHNQGNVPAKNILVSDYLPGGYGFAANNGWSLAGPGLLQNTILSTINPGGFVTLTLDLTLQTGAGVTTWDNYAEVSQAEDDMNVNRNDDADSVSDTNENNDNPILPGDPDDDSITGLGPNASQDEDDHDPAAPEIVDIALDKNITTAGPYYYGQTVNYDITLTNQGNIALTNIVIKDELPCGMTYSGGSQAWTVAGNEAITTYTGMLQPNTSATVTISVTLNECYTNPSSAWTNIAQVVSMEDEDGDDVSDDDVDSDPDNDDPTEDDQDEETLNVFDLALRKTLLTGAPYSYGQTLTFEIEVFNQGNVPASNILVKDHIPNGYSYVSNNGWTGTLPNLQNTIAGPIAPGSSATLQLELILQTSSSGSFTNYAEIAGGNGPSGPGFDADSNPDSNTSEEQDVEPGDPDDDNINGGGPNEGEDEDDHDPAGPSIFDLALRKTVDTATPSYSYGQSVMYTIRVFNQGNIAARDIEVRDTIPCGFEFDPMDLANAGWTQSGQVITRTISSVLNPGQSAAVMVNYIVRPCYTNPATAWTNYAEISDAINDETGLPGEDIDSSPDDNMENDNGGVPDFNGVLSGTDNTINNENGDEDDHDPHQIQVFDLALRKVLATAGPYSYGQTLTFQIEVHNQGNVPAKNILVSDYLPVGYGFAANNGWSLAGPGLLQNTILSTINPGGFVTLTLDLTLQTGAGVTTWDNYAEVSQAEDDMNVNRNDDADSVSDTNENNDNPILPGDPDDDSITGLGPNASQDEDDHDPAAPEIVDIALDKNITTAGPYYYGQTVNYDIILTNQGNIALTNIVIKDELPCGMTYSGGSQAWTVAGNEAITTYTGMLQPNTSATVTISVTLNECYTNPSSAWTNIAQVVSMEDEDGDDVSDDDVDSDPDNDDPTEDDQDEETLNVFDLALRKQLTTSPPYNYGQLHTFTVQVYNQGNFPATNVVVNDYVPVGYGFVANNGWTSAGPGLIQNTIAGPIAPGGSSILTLQLTLLQSDGGERDWINYSEIASGNGPNGPGFDADSSPNSNGPNENGIVPGGSGDDDILSNSDTGVGSQDDHDPAGPSIFDLALTKIATTAAPSYSYGQVVTYEIEVYNQGSVPASNIQIADYIPCGLQFNPALLNNGGWSLAAPGRLSRNIPGVLNPGSSTTVLLDLVVAECYTNPATAWTNYSEITLATDVTTGNQGNDIDSDPDANSGNDSGGVPDFNGNISGTDNTIDNENGDEDDHDPHQIQVFDLALRKILTTVGPYNYGQLLTFNVEVFNQGNVTAENIVISDYLPDGYSFVNNNGWISAGPGLLQHTIAGPLGPGSSISLTLQLTLTSGTTNVSWDNYSEVSSSQDDQGFDRNDDADSVLDTNENNDNPVLPGDVDDNNILGLGPNASQDEDDHDPAAPVIVDIALNKTVTTAEPYIYGQTVSYDIVLTNQGNIPLSNIVVKDELPCGMTYNGGSQPWTVVGNEATTTYTGILQPFTSTTISIIVTLNVCYTNPSTAWTNIAQVVSMEDEDGDDVSDDDVDSDPDNDDPTEDDQDEETLNVFDLALRKQLTTSPPYNYGQLHTFTVQVYNQGNFPATNVVVNDYVPVGYGFVANNGWTSAGPGLIQNTIAGPIAPGGSSLLTLQLTLLQSDGGERDWINYSEIASGNGPNGPGFDADSSPNSNGPNENGIVPGGSGDDDILSNSDTGVGSQDDHDPAGPSIFDLALTKRATTAAPSYSYGQVVTYEIEVFNQGNVAAGTIQVSDYIPCGLSFEPGLANNSLWYMAGPNRAAFDMNIILLPGESTKIYLDLRVQECYSDPNNAWTNFSEITLATDVTTGNQGNDIDSNPDANSGNDSGGVPDFNGNTSGTDNTINNENGDEDDQDPHKIQVFDLALRKLVDDRGPYMIGETATFRITVFNQGNVPSSNIVVNDYIRSGFTFPPNPGWSMITPPTPAADGLLQYTIGGPLLPGASQELTLNLVVALDANPAVADWFNYAEINSAQDDMDVDRNDDADSWPNSDSPYENNVLPDDPWDNVIDGGGPLVSEDEDDHDPEKVIVVGGLGDTVWKDVNGNGIQDPGEPGVRNVIARLQDCNGNTLATTLTDATGFYFFNNLIPGNYNVRFDITGLTPGCQYTLQDQGGDDETDSDVDLSGLGPCTYITGGEFDSTYDAGLLILAELGNYVWHDLNGDGIQNPGEPGIEGVEVNLYHADGTFYATTTTNASGFYIFEDLYPGDYFVKFVGPEGFESTFANMGGNDATDSDADGTNGEGTTQTINLESGESDMTWDAGFYKCIPVGEVVWYDFNKNDFRDTYENGINGLEVNIYRRVGGSWQLFDTKFTGHKPGTPSDDGYWKFCVPPGTYYVNVDMPPLGLVRVRPNVGGDSNRDSDLTNANGPMSTASFTVFSGQMKCDIGAGFYPMAVTGNTVWIDENINGIQEGNELNIEGVIVEARNVQTNELMATSVTDHNGNYEMDYLERGGVYFRFELPSGYTQYTPTVARNGQDNVDSDVDGTYGPGTTRMFVMEPSMANMDIDFGVALSPLPVDWLNVSARKTDNHHLVSWATAREVNASHYVVERRRNNETGFTALPGEVKAKGYSNKREDYSYTDKDIAVGGIYVYRVKQVDVDGKYTYSNEVSVVQNTINSVDIYPNPAKGMTNMNIQLASDTKLDIKIYDNAGALVRSVKSNELMERGSYTETLNIAGLASGVYNVQIELNGEQIQKKLVVVD
jgi:uncharacterized repeat protein (TIGR01451 family)